MKYGELVNASYLTPESIHRLQNITDLLLLEVKALEDVFQCSDFHSYVKPVASEEAIVASVVSNDENKRNFLSGRLDVILRRYTLLFLFIPPTYAENLFARNCINLLYFIILIS